MQRPSVRGESCLITITATPASSGVFSGTVSIAASPGAVTPFVVSVIATVGGGLIFSVAPTVINLGNIPVGIAAPKQVITITAGMPFDDLVISSAGQDVSLDWVRSTCAPTLAAHASCTVVVDFLATTSGAKSEAIIISAGGATGKTVTVPITANVQSPAKLVVSPSTPQSLVCSSPLPSPLRFGVANSGDGPTGTITAEITGPAADAFEIKNACSILAPLAGCVVSVICTRYADYGDPTQATLVVADTGVGGSSVAVSLSNAGLGGPDALTILPATSDLGSAVVGETGASTSFTGVKRTYGETGSLRVSVSNIEFVITYDTCSGVSLDRDGSCTFSVALKPVTAGVKTAVVTVTGEVGGPGQRTLTGTALEPDPPLDGGSG